jgi:hypothetical protein
MQLVKNKLEVRHFAQVPCKAFCVAVKDEYEALKIINTLAAQHNFLFEQNIIPDFANVILVVMWDESENDWVDYYNDAEEMEWSDIEEVLMNAEPSQD